MYCINLKAQNNVIVRSVTTAKVLAELKIRLRGLAVLNCHTRLKVKYTQVKIFVLGSMFFQVHPFDFGSEQKML